jgi:hypothetical protein
MNKQRTQYLHLDKQQLLVRIFEPEITLLELMAMSSTQRKIYKQQCRKKGIAIPTK